MLLCVLDHPTQYDPPLWRAMTRAGRQVPRVWYVVSDAPGDPEMNQAITWSIPLDGYDHRRVPVSELARSLRELQPRPTAILVPGWRRPATLRILPVARALGIPVILGTDKTLNEASPGGPAGLAYTAFHSAKARAFQGFFTTGLLGTQYLASLGAPHEAIAQGLYPVDIAYWQERMRASSDKTQALRAGMPSASFTVLAVCKLSEREDPLLLLDAVAKLKQTDPNVRLIQVGDGPLRAVFERRIVELGLERNVSLVGYVSYPELAGCYAAADVFVHFPAAEPWGISVLEAMACGVPVVASTTVGAAADLVLHGRTGAMAYPRDPASLAAALQLVKQRVVGNERAKQLIAQGIRRFDVDAAGDSLAALCERLTAGVPADRALGSVLVADVRNEFGRWSL